MSGPHRLSCQTHIKWYITDVPGFAILGLPSSAVLKIVKLNCSLYLAKTAIGLCYPPVKLLKEHDTVHRGPDRIGMQSNTSLLPN